jgi:hypothetical protein
MSTSASIYHFRRVRGEDAVSTREEAEAHGYWPVAAIQRAADRRTGNVLQCRQTVNNPTSKIYPHLRKPVRWFIITERAFHTKF